MLYIKFFIVFFLLTALSAKDIIVPIPSQIPYNHSKALLGKKLFQDPKLSRDGTVSCAHCHLLDAGGVDHQPFSFGIQGRVGNINAPTVYNSVFNISQFWDGRAKDLKAQVMGPLLNPNEMDTDIKEMLAYLQNKNSYLQAFKENYHDGVTLENVQDAIAEFEKALITPHSRFDRFLQGDEKSLTAEEKEGYALFKGFGCIACHNGVNLGSNLYQKLGIMKEYHDATNNLGRFNVTKKNRDRYYYKVPTLRNIALTAPYLHNGSIKTLPGVVRIMIEHQLGRIPKKSDVTKIVKFLETLTGELPEIVKEK